MKWFLVLGICLILFSAAALVYAQGAGEQDPIAEHPSSSKEIVKPIIPVKPVASATPFAEPIPSV